MLKTILNELYLPFLSRLGLSATENLSDFNHCGLSYELDPAIGTGYYWVYPVENLFAITIYDLVFKSDISLQCDHPPFLCLGCYKTSHAKKLLGQEVTHSESLIGYVGHKDIYQLTLNKDMSICSIGISLMPDFYEKFLPKKYPGNFGDLTHLFSRLNGSEIIPEIMLVLKQIRTFKPSREISKMYYEGKVMELLSLVIQWGRNQILFSVPDCIPDWELDHLSRVEAYLNENYTNTIPLDALAKIACMSHNKLTNSFKQVYGSTITAYIKSLRIQRAKEMLLSSDRKISEIANEVGYKLHGSFTEVFKDSTGFTPNEFRKNFLQYHS